MAKTHTVTLIPGDGIGPEVCRAAVSVLKRAVEATLAMRKFIPRDLGGTASCTEVTRAVCDNLI